MKLYSVETSQKLPISISKAWDFLSSPGNLKVITPPHMGFEITSKFNNEKMFPGQVIAYKIKPFPMISMNWVTEITHVNEPNYFVDEQRFGPYKFWHHKHFLKEINGGVEMSDTVHYGIPLGWLGQAANEILVKKQLQSIFDYRYKKLENLFGKL